MFVNLTPHDVVVFLNDDESVTIPASGKVARVESKPQRIRHLQFDDVASSGCGISGVRGCRQPAETINRNGLHREHARPSALRRPLGHLCSRYGTEVGRSRREGAHRRRPLARGSARVPTVKTPTAIVLAVLLGPASVVAAYVAVRVLDTHWAHREDRLFALCEDQLTLIGLTEETATLPQLNTHCGPIFRDAPPYQSAAHYCSEVFYDTIGEHLDVTTRNKGFEVCEYAFPQPELWQRP